MNRYIIGSLWDRNNRNGANKNFEYLFEGRQKIDELNNRADSILTTANNVNARNNNTNERLDNIIADSGTSSTEVVDARGPFNVLSARLNDMNNSIGNVDVLGIEHRGISQSLFERGVNVKDFGAKGDGDTDDSEAFKSAAEYVDVGVVIIPPGTFIVEDLPLKTGLYYKGSGVNSTTLILPDNPSGNMFNAEIGLNDIVGGGATNLSMRGSKTDVKANKNGFDFSTLSRLDRFEIMGVKAEYFDMSYNGTNNDRWAYITNTQFYNNRVGIYAGEHPILVNVDCRDNDVGLTGRLNDLTALNCRFNYNRVGAEPAPGTGNYIHNSFFQNTGFWGNSEKALEINNANIVTGCRLSGYSLSDDDVGVVIAGSNNKIHMNNFAQSEGTSFGGGFIVFDGIRHMQGTSITHNLLNLIAGPGIIAHKDVNMYEVDISHNTVLSTGSTMHPFLKVPAERAFTRNRIKDNMFIISGELIDNFIEIPFAHEGNMITDNSFRLQQKSKIDSILSIDLSGTQFINNRFMISPSATLNDPVEVLGKNSETIISGNSGSRLGDSGGVQEEWIKPILSNDWKEDNPSDYPVGYFKDSNGIVHFRGLISHPQSSVNKEVFRLPVGYVPSNSVRVTLPKNGLGSINGIITKDGIFQPNFIPNQDASEGVFLDGISFATH